MACYMSLISQLASKAEVLRIAPLHSAKKLNAIASAIIESGTERHTPLRDIGLDGTGEVIQVLVLFPDRDSTSYPLFHQA